MMDLICMIIFAIIIPLAIALAWLAVGVFYGRHPAEPAGVWLTFDIPGEPFALLVRLRLIPEVRKAALAWRFKIGLSERTMSLKVKEGSDITALIQAVRANCPGSALAIHSGNVPNRQSAIGNPK